MRMIVAAAVALAIASFPALAKDAPKPAAPPVAKVEVVKPVQIVTQPEPTMPRLDIHAECGKPLKTVEIAAVCAQRLSTNWTAAGSALVGLSLLFSAAAVFTSFVTVREQRKANRIAQNVYEAENKDLPVVSIECTSRDILAAANGRYPHQVTLTNAGRHPFRRVMLGTAVLDVESDEIAEMIPKVRRLLENKIADNIPMPSIMPGKSLPREVLIERPIRDGQRKSIWKIAVITLFYSEFRQLHVGKATIFLANIRIPTTAMEGRPGIRLFALTETPDITISDRAPVDDGDGAKPETG